MSSYPDAPPPKYEPPAAGYSNQPPTAGYPPSQPAAAGYPPPGAGYPPPAAGYAPQPGPYPPHHQHATVVVTQPVVIPGATMRFGQAPATITCQHCQATVTTATDYTTGLMTWLLAGGICIVGLFCGCCLIPFCIDAGKDVVHNCPNCKRQVGMFKQIR